MSNKFPSIDTVHETLSDLTKLFEDRNAILNSMFKEDKYKDFLLAENIQSLVEADKRDDAAGGKIKKDLANGYEVLKAKTNMQQDKRERREREGGCSKFNMKRDPFLPDLSAQEMEDGETKKVGSRWIICSILPSLWVPPCCSRGGFLP